LIDKKSGRLIEIRVKVIEIPLVLRITHLLPALNPLRQSIASMSSRQRIDAPVNEESKPVVDEPLSSLHRPHLLRFYCHISSSLISWYHKPMAFRSVEQSKVANASMPVLHVSDRPGELIEPGKEPQLIWYSKCKSSQIGAR